MGYLTTYYTTSFDAWTEHNSRLPWQPGNAAYAICAINLARLTNASSILPAAFYMCATLGPYLADGALLEDGSTEKLTSEDMHLVFEMRTRLAVENAQAGFLLFQPQLVKRCSGGTRWGGCAAVRAKLLEDAGQFNAPHPIASERALDSWMWNAEVPTMSIFDRLEGRRQELRQYLCDGCMEHLRVRERELRRQTWRKLPGLLGLTIKNWDA